MDFREHTLNILLGFWQSTPRLKSHLESYFIKHKLDGKIRRRIVAYCNDIVRWVYLLDTWIEQASSRTLKQIDEQVLCVLEMAVYELKLDKKVPDHAAIHSAVDLVGRRVGSYAKGYVNGVLRAISRRSPDDLKKRIKADKYLSLWYSYPDWITKRWEQRFGTAAIETVLAATNQPAPLTVRINSNRISASEFMNWCKEHDIGVQPDSTSDRFFQVSKNGFLLYQAPEFQKGIWSFQDRGAGMLVELLNPQPNETILDVCAAPGTKTFYISEILQGTGNIIANDISGERVAQGKVDSSRHESGNIHWQCSDGTTAVFPLVDKILIDAPCTGTGVIRRRPDIKWRREPESIPEMQNQQLAILSNVSQYVKSGGIIVYGTCSMEPEENEDVITLFLKDHKEFSIDQNIPEHLVHWKNAIGAVETFPHRDSLDGMFGIRLMRHD